MAPLLEITGLRKVYRRGHDAVVALDNVDLAVCRGEVVGLLGPNGAGKTTLVKCVCTLALPDEGQVSILGSDPFRYRRNALRSIGAVLEGSRNIYWQLSPRENMRYFGRMRGMSEGHLSSRMGALLEALSLDDAADQPVRTLSRGTQQRAAVAVALIHDPPLVLLDEPTLGLDLPSTTAVVEEVRRMTAGGKGVLITTHQLEIAERLCDRIAIIRKGRVLLCEPTHELLRRFDAGRTTSISLSEPLDATEVERLKAAHPGLTVVIGSREAVLQLPAVNGTSPERLFVDLWQSGHSIRSFTRATSLREVYLRVVDDQR